MERERGEWCGRWGEGEESFEEEGVRGAGGEHELVRGVVSGGVLHLVEKEDCREGSVTASAPCLFFHGIQRGKRVASSVATAGEVSTAMRRGVSQFALRLMLSSSWPASIRNSWFIA